MNRWNFGFLHLTDAMALFIERKDRGSRTMYVEKLSISVNNSTRKRVVVFWKDNQKKVYHFPTLHLLQKVDGFTFVPFLDIKDEINNLSFTINYEDREGALVYTSYNGFIFEVKDFKELMFDLPKK